MKKDMIYENEIEMLFTSYVQDHKTEKKINNALFLSACHHVYKNMFKMSCNILTGSAETTIKTEDVETIYNIMNIYIDLCERCNVGGGLYGFERLTGIPADMVKEWNDKTMYIYIDKDKKIIPDIEKYKRENPYYNIININNIYEIDSYNINNNNNDSIHTNINIYLLATSIYKDIYKKITTAQRQYYRGALSDSPVGQITLANNDTEIGLQYSKEMINTASAAFNKPMLTREELLQIAKQ